MDNRPDAGRERMTPRIDPARLARAVHLDAAPIDNGRRWHVTGGKAPHFVSADASRCDCADFAYRRATCKHRLAVSLRRGDPDALLALREVVRRFPSSPSVPTFSR
jgi:hypothetical protein